MMYGYGGYGAGWSWFGMGLMMFFGLMVIVGVVLLVVWLARSGGTHPGTYVPPQPPTNEACEIAKVRYAKGEITKEQYEEICRTIGM